MGESRRGEESQKREAGVAGKGKGESSRGEAEGGDKWGRPGGRGERDQAEARPLTEAGGEVWASAVSWRTDALERAVGVGTDAALAEVLLAAFVHVCGTVSETAGGSPSLLNIPSRAPPPPFPRPSSSKTLTPSPPALGSSLYCKPHLSAGFGSILSIHCPIYPDSALSPFVSQLRPSLSPPFPDPGPAWVRTEARSSARSGPVTGSTSTGKGAVGVEALAVGEAKVALQALVHV